MCYVNLIYYIINILLLSALSLSSVSFATLQFPAGSLQRQIDDGKLIDEKRLDSTTVNMPCTRLNWNTRETDRPITPMVLAARATIQYQENAFHNLQTIIRYRIQNIRNREGWGHILNELRHIHFFGSFFFNLFHNQSYLTEWVKFLFREGLRLNTVLEGAGLVNQNRPFTEWLDTDPHMTPAVAEAIRLEFQRLEEQERNNQELQRVEEEGDNVQVQTMQLNDQGRSLRCWCAFLVVLIGAGAAGLGYGSL